MKKFTSWLTSACLLALLITGCHSSRHVSSSASTNNRHDPQFIDSISLGGHNTSTVANENITGSTRHKKSRHKKHRKENNPLVEKYASLLEVSPDAITNYALYSFIDEWYGVNYRRGGTDKNGIDCSAFAQRLYQDVFSINLVRTSVEQFSQCRMKNDADDLKEGDLVFFHINSRHITHVGVYLMNNFFVHASTSNGVMISSMNDPYWQKSFAGAGVVPKG